MAARPPAFEGRGYYADSVLERPLPHAAEAEEILCGAVFSNPANLDRIQEKLLPEMFYLPQTRLILRTQIALAETGLAFDEGSVIDELQRQDKLEAAGGLGFISRLADGIPKLLNLDSYMESVARTWRARTLAKRADALREAAMRGEEEEMQACLAALQHDAKTFAKPRLIALSTGDLLQMNVPPREMILAPILPTQSLAMLFSKRGIGKTFLSLGLAHAVATGGQFLRWQATRPRSVLFVDGELPLCVLRERLACVIGGAESRQCNPLLKFITPDVQEGPMPDLSTASGQALLEGHLEGVELVILDNLSALCVSGKENEGESWLPLQSWALRLRQRGISVLFVHHAGKSGTQRGTSRREDLLDTVISLRHPSDYSTNDGLRCEVHFEKCRGFLGKDAEPFEVRLETSIEGAAVWTMRDLEDVTASRVAHLLADGLSIREVAKELGISKSKAHRLKAKTRETGQREPEE